MSDLVNLSQCMVDSDAAANGRAKRLRRKALAASLALEAAVLAGLILWPLVTLGVLPPQLVITPVPPFHGMRGNRPAQPQPPEHPASNRPSISVSIVQQPPRVPNRVDASPDAEPPSIDGRGDQLGPSESLPWISGANDRGPSIEIARPGLDAKPRMVSRGVMDASLIHRVEPEYPKIAKAMRLSGTVLLRATIGTDGEVRELEVLSGNMILANAAVKAVREWRYRPTLLSGEAVEVETRITVNFILQ